MDPFEENIEGLYQSADTEGRGYITRDEFIAVCCSTFIGTSVNTHARTHTQKHTHTHSVVQAGATGSVDGGGPLTNDTVL